MILPVIIIPYNQNVITVPNTFGMSLNILSVSLWNVSPTGAALNCILTNLYLPN